LEPEFSWVEERLNWSEKIEHLSPPEAKPPVILLKWQLAPKERPSQVSFTERKSLVQPKYKKNESVTMRNGPEERKGATQQG